MKFYYGKVALFTPDFEKLVALLTPALIGVSLIFKTGGIRAGVKGAGVKKRAGGKRADKVCEIQFEPWSVPHWYSLSSV